jgi:hypothetical protein
MIRRLAGVARARRVASSAAATAPEALNAKTNCSSDVVALPKARYANSARAKNPSRYSTAAEMACRTVWKDLEFIKVRDMAAARPE